LLVVLGIRALPNTCPPWTCFILYETIKMQHCPTELYVMVEILYFCTVHWGGQWQSPWNVYMQYLILINANSHLWSWLPYWTV
jgi:hypothetical protein